MVSLGLIFWAGPRYGSKVIITSASVADLDHVGLPVGMFAHRILECCCDTGLRYFIFTRWLILGAAIVAQAQGTPQFNQWFLYVLLVFVVCTLLTEIVYLNVCCPSEIANCRKRSTYSMYVS